MNTMLLAGIFGSIGVSLGLTALISFDLKLPNLAWTCLGLAILCAGAITSL